MDSVFIEASKLGSVLEGLLRGLSFDPSRRARKRSVARMNRLLQDLKLVDGRVAAIGVAVDSTGTVGMLATYHTVRVQGTITQGD